MLEEYEEEEDKEEIQREKEDHSYYI